jgi:hypothetical protein
MVLFRQRGTGVCALCADNRVVNALASPAGRLYLAGWADRIRPVLDALD